MTVSLVSKVARPISSALSSTFSMDAMGKLDAYGKLGTAWSPLSLFAASEVGAWYDPSDLTTMFQDRAGTTPVTADGQTVGLILDKSGRGNHAVAPSDAARPLYKTDGTYHWLQFDGVDDSLSTAAINFTGTNKMSMFSGVYKASNASVSIFVELSTNYNSNTGTFFITQPNDVAGTEHYSSRGSAASAADQAAIVQFVAVSKGVISVNHDIAGDLSIVRRNGVAGINGTGDKGLGNFGNYPMYIGGRGGTSYMFTGNIYSLIVRGALSTADEITATETWVNGKTGAY